MLRVYQSGLATIMLYNKTLFPHLVIDIRKHLFLIFVSVDYLLFADLDCAQLGLSGGWVQSAPWVSSHPRTSRLPGT